MGHFIDGTYYYRVVENTAVVRVETNNEFAKVEFNGKTGIQMLEQVITLDPENKVTEVSVKITSQQGSVIETIIYLEKVSDNNNLVEVNVNSNPVENTEEENVLLAYIYDTAERARIEIEAEHEEATIVRTVENGDTYLDENALSTTAKEKLIFNVDTPNDVTMIYFKIVEESGKGFKVYTLRIEKMSTDTTLKEIYVEGKLVLPNEEGKYITSVLDTVKTPNAKTITNSDLAYVRIALGYSRTASNNVKSKTNNNTNNSKITIRNNKSNICIYKQNINISRTSISNSG